MTFKKIGRRQYENSKFKPGQTGFMSIKNVYDAVKKIGGSKPGTLHELSIFSHAFWNGPILVNSNENNTAGGARDDFDFDARFHDFSAPRMNEPDQNLFAKAYHMDGYNWIWGCNADDTPKEIMRSLIQHRDYKKIGLKDADKFVFSSLRKKERDSLRDMLSILSIPIAKKGPVELNFRQIRIYFGRLMASSYMFAFATTSGRVTFGGLPSMSAEPDKSGKLQLSHIKTNIFFWAIIRFYTNYLDIELGPEKRNYAAYLPNQSFRKLK